MTGAPADPPGPGLTDAGEARESRRLKVFRVAQVGVAPDVARCHILNLSHAGALIDCRDAPTTPRDLTLAAAGFARDADVRWRAGTRMGVRFHLPLEDGELLAAL